MWRAIKRGTDTEYYCVTCECLGGQYREELILNITVFVLRVWEEQYRGELLLNVTVSFVGVWNNNIEMT